MNQQIVYIGNRLSKWGYTPTSVETLGERLREIAAIYPYSDKKNAIHRMCHMLLGIWKHRRKTHWVIIDTYSSSAFYFAFLCALWCRLLKLPYITVLRGGDLPNRLIKSPRLCQSTFHKAYRIIAPSSYLYNPFKQAGFKQVITIPNYIDIVNYPFKHRTNPQPRILWVRSFHKTYNPNLAIDILANLKLSFPAATLCMVGPDKDGSMAQFEAYANEKGLMDAIQIKGRLNKTDWIALSANYDVFLNTTDFDNTPVSVMEAMALGMLVVSTNAGGVPAIIQHEQEGLLFNRGDATTAVALIKQILDPAVSGHFSSSARARAEHWDWTLVRAQWQSILSTSGLSNS
ncbi:MAG: glycosyltransferase family 4 protein [Chitinophagaceae bacterium]|nr:glycosyltransferase family 4 protein [Chitinophagaceae bacterium]